MVRAALLLACLIFLAGCEAVAVGFAGANMAALNHADKTLPDIALSAQQGKNCSLLNASRNQSYCQSAPPDPAVALADLADTRYCYRTLGRIDCYERPDFLASGLTRVNFATGYLPPGREPPALARRPAKGIPMAGIPAPAEPIAEPPAAVPSPAAPAKGGPKDAAAGTKAKKAPAARNPAKKKAGAAAPVHKDAAISPAAPAVSADPGRLGTPVAQVPPLVTLPGQGTY